MAAFLGLSILSTRRLLLSPPPSPYLLEIVRNARPKAHISFLPSHLLYRKRFHQRPLHPSSDQAG